MPSSGQNEDGAPGSSETLVTIHEILLYVVITHKARNYISIAVKISSNKQHVT
jgi:hypothetical protein